MTDAKNVLGGRLEMCCNSPITGFYRTGRCDTGPEDFGEHVICAEVTQEFLDFSRFRGNDLASPQGDFPGLKPGDRWCLCAARWKEALEAGFAPKVILAATHEAALEVISIGELVEYALDLA